jgi:hypothetical protein
MRAGAAPLQPREHRQQRWAWAQAQLREPRPVGSGTCSTAPSSQQRARPLARRPARAASVAAAMLALALLLVVGAGARGAAAMSVQYCPEGRSMETGLCYPRCPIGSVGLGCSCWAYGRATWRGCGVAPSACEARSFRAPRLPPAAADRGPFTLLLSADPQLFRNYTRYEDRRGAEAINRNLVRAINRVRDLGDWPGDVGGGPVQEPRSMVVLGDLTEFYMERQQDAFRHFYDPSYPGGSAADRVRFPTWLMLGVSWVFWVWGGWYLGAGGVPPAAAAGPGTRRVLAARKSHELWDGPATDAAAPVGPLASDHAARPGQPPAFPPPPSPTPRRAQKLATPPPTHTHKHRTTTTSTTWAIAARRPSTATSAPSGRSP